MSKCSNNEGLLEEKLQSSLVESYCENEGVLDKIKLHISESLESTNDFVMSLVSESVDDVIVCFANAQTKGKGRNGKVWYSPASSNIYMSVSYGFTGSSLLSLSGLSLACGVAIASMLKELGIQPQLKWPNDVWVDGKKIAGILIETRVKGSKITAVVGVGLNVSMDDHNAENIDQPWTDLVRCLDSEKSVSRNLLAAKMLKSILDVCFLYKTHGFQMFESDWAEFDVLKGKQVEADMRDKTITATVLGINDDGSLRVVIDGREERIYAADVKIKLI